MIGPPTSKRWAYAVSKMYDEHYGLALADEHGLRITILRLFNAYGPRNHLSWWGGPVVTFVESLLDGEPMEMHGDGRQTRTFTHVRDTADGIVRALERPAARGEVINLGGTETITILELASRIQVELGLPAEPLRARFLPLRVAARQVPGCPAPHAGHGQGPAAARLRGEGLARRGPARHGRVAPGGARRRRGRSGLTERPANYELTETGAGAEAHCTARRARAGASNGTDSSA